MSLLGATILTAIATLALAVGAIVTAVLAYFAWRKQSREVTAIEQQLDLQRQEFDTKRTEARRAQASRVFFWTDSRTDDEDYPRGLAPGMKLGPSRVVITAHIRNASDLPVFSVRIAAYQEGKQAPLWGDPEHIEILMPGEQADRSRAKEVPDVYAWIDHLFGGGFMAASFRDTAGARWIIGPQGTMVEDQPTGTLRHE